MSLLSRCDGTRFLGNSLSFDGVNGAIGNGHRLVDAVPKQAVKK